LSVDTGRCARQTPHVFAAGRSQRRLTRTLNAAYATGLLSEDTFARRLDELVGRSVIEPGALIGDLNLRAGARQGLRSRLRRSATELWSAREERTVAPEPRKLLALDWTGADSELLLGRHHGCDIRLTDLSVSRRHAQLRFRDGRWILQDLDSTNGTRVNGVRVGRCELRPGDAVEVGELRLLVD
jgi:hypothetical protein